MKPNIKLIHITESTISIKLGNRSVLKYVINEYSRLHDRKIRNMGILNFHFASSIVFILAETDAGRLRYSIHFKTIVYNTEDTYLILAVTVIYHDDYLVSLNDKCECLSNRGTEVYRRK